MPIIVPVILAAVVILAVTAAALIHRLDRKRDSWLRSFILDRNEWW